MEKKASKHQEQQSSIYRETKLFLGTNGVDCLLAFK